MQESLIQVQLGVPKVEAKTWKSGSLIPGWVMVKLTENAGCQLLIAGVQFFFLEKPYYCKI